MSYKEKEFDKDKAVWIQKYELCSHELNETREQLESQKLHYLQIIASLKLSCSPVKQSYNLEINLTPSQKKTLDQSISFISDHEAIRQSVKLKENETMLNEILLRESVQLDIHARAKELAEGLWSNRESAHVLRLQQKI